MVRFELLEPQSLSEACSWLAEHKEDAKIIAGGQNLLVLLRHRLIKPKYLINIKGLTELDYIKDGGSLKLGALTTHRTLEISSLVRERVPMLAELERELGCIQTRNWGTIGGNLCQASPATDLSPALIALEASAKVMSIRGERAIPLDDFFTGYQETSLEPDEILVEIQLPEPLPHTGGVYHKETVRLADPPFASVAAVVRLSERGAVEKVRIVIQAVGVTPLRASEAEKIMLGEKVEAKLLEEVARLTAKAAQPISDIYGSADYKRKMIAVITKQVVAKAARRAAALPKGGKS